MRGMLILNGAKAVDVTILGALGVSHLFLGTQHLARKNQFRKEGRKIIAFDGETDFAGVVAAGDRAVEHFVQGAAQLALQSDGLLLGWRAPGFDKETGKDSENAISEGVRFAGMVKLLHRAVGRERELGILLPVKTPHVRRILTVLEDMKPHVSFFVLAAHDGAWTMTRSGHVSALFPTVDSAFQTYTRVLRPEKIVLAVPAWVTVFDRCDGFAHGYGSRRVGTAEGMSGSPFIVRDTAAGAMPIIEGEGCVMAFEDGASLAAKRDYCRSRGLGGSVLVLGPDGDAVPDEAFALWDDMRPPPPRTVSMPPRKSPKRPRSPSPPPRRKRRHQQQQQQQQRQRIVADKSEWSPMDEYDEGEVVSVGKLVFRCAQAHVPTFPVLRRDLWEPLPKNFWRQSMGSSPDNEEEEKGDPTSPHLQPAVQRSPDL